MPPKLLKNKVNNNTNNVDESNNNNNSDNNNNNNVDENNINNDDDYIEKIYNQSDMKQWAKKCMFICCISLIAFNIVENKNFKSVKVNVDFMNTFVATLRQEKLLSKNPEDVQAANEGRMPSRRFKIVVSSCNNFLIIVLDSRCGMCFASVFYFCASL